MTLLNKIYRYKIHIICWVIYIFYEVVVTGLLTGKFSSFGLYFCFYCLNIVTFYVFAHFILPYSIKHKDYIYWLLPLLILLAFGVYVFFTIYLDGILIYIATKRSKFYLEYDILIRTIYRFLYFIGFSTGYYYLINSFKERKRAEQQEKKQLLIIIEKEKIQTSLIKSQNALLKAQINPHFLFNTLNYIYTSSRKTSPEAAESIMALSQMMRFAIDNGNNSEESEILMEIEQVENLIYLHQIRQNNQLNIKLDYDDENLMEVKIIPLIIITLTENIFKHGDLSDPQTPALISIHKGHNALYIETHNIKDTGNKMSHNIGIDNIKKRLNMAYKDRNNFKSYSHENQFHVELEIRQN